MRRLNSFMLFDIKTGIDPATGRPTDTEITNVSIGTAKGFSNLGLQTRAVAGIPLTAVTDRIRIPTIQYKLQRNILAQNKNGKWKLWTVTPTGSTSLNDNLTELAMQEVVNANLLTQAITFYNSNKGGV